MSGLIDSATGLDSGTNLQFQTQIGTAGLIVQSGIAVVPEVLASDGSFMLSSDADSIVTAR